MNRSILIRVAGPALAIAPLLCGTCLASAWYINRLQATMANVLSDNVACLQAAQELQIHVRQLRYHCFIYLLDPRPERLPAIEGDQHGFEEALQAARQSAHSAEARACVRDIEAGYQRYQEELAHLRQRAGRDGTRDGVGRLTDPHPIRFVVDPCQRLLEVSRAAMHRAAGDSERVGRQARWVMLLVGILGPLGGLAGGLVVAWGLSRSIFRLSVRVQDVAQRLDQDVASVQVIADGDLRRLDRDLQHVLARVEEVAERVQRHQREMLRAEQLAAVGRLAAGVAHEVRNPLTAVKMLVDMARQSRTPQALTAADLEVIHREVTRMEQTVQGLLDFARLPTPRRADCDLRDVIAAAAGLVQARARQQKVEVAVSQPAEPVPTCVDRDQLGTVLVNLFLNALDAMPGGGRLEVSLSTNAGGAIEITVADTGTGIAPEVVGRLFTPFASTKPTGTGLGLNLSRRIVEEHGGTLAAANRSGGGACFTIRLPHEPSAGGAANGRAGAGSIEGSCARSW